MKSVQNMMVKEIENEEIHNEISVKQLSTSSTREFIVIILLHSCIRRRRDDLLGFHHHQHALV